MKKSKLILIIFLLSLTKFYAQQSNIWRFNLHTEDTTDLNYHKESITLTQKGTKLYGTLNDGGKINLILNGSLIKGHFRHNKKIYKLEGQKGDNIFGKSFYGKYCSCSGNPDKIFTLARTDEVAITNLQGTWSSTYGDLRLHQIGDRIFGDYKHVGVIKAVIKGNLVSGTFTNGNSKGIFKWILRENSFTGKWAWDGQTLDGNWNGTLKSTKKPILKNF